MYKIYYSRKEFALLNDHPSYRQVKHDNICGTKTFTYNECDSTV